MLVLSRNQGEKIRIGEDITVVVVRLGHSVRLGIEAPPDIVVMREELIDGTAAGPQPYLARSRRAPAEG